MIHRILVLGTALSALAGSCGVLAQSAPPEVQVTRNHIADYEFDWGRDGIHCPTCNGGAGNARFTFTDSSNSLWVGYIDHDTGAFLPLNGRGELADTDAAQTTDFGNGPEWMNTAEGSQIAYVKYLPGMPHEDANAGLALAKQIAGTWSAGFIDGGMQRYSPLGSLDLDDPSPRLLYQKSADQKAYWRFADDPASEVAVPSSRPVCSRRWVPGRHAIVYTAPCLLRAGGSRPAQVYWFDLATGIEEQITFDATWKLHAFAWQAPELDNDWVVFTVINRTTLQVLRQVTADDGTTSWTLFSTISTPPDMPYVTSPESFVHNGKSYITMQLSASASANDFTVPTQIAITGIDPAAPGLRVLTSDTSAPRLRLDPEYYITSQGPFIYYNRFLAATQTSGVKIDGVWRVDTGLGPPLLP